MSGAFDGGWMALARLSMYLTACQIIIVSLNKMGRVGVRRLAFSIFSSQPFEVTNPQKLTATINHHYMFL